MPTAVIEQLGFTKKGAAKVKLTGTWYMLPKEMKDHADMSVGREISFESHAWRPPNGTSDMWFIDKWGLLPAHTNGHSPPTNGAAVAPAVAPPLQPGYTEPQPRFTDIPPGLCGIIKSLIESGKPSAELSSWIRAARHVMADPSVTEQATEPGRMEQIAAKGALTRKANEYSERMLGLFRAGNESAAVEIWLREVKGPNEPPDMEISVWAALPKTVQQRLQDLVDERSLHGRLNGDPGPDIEF